MTDITFDEAQDAFRASPSLATAKAYAKQAQGYHRDGMIGEDTFGAVRDEVAAYVTLVPLP